MRAGLLVALVAFAGGPAPAADTPAVDDGPRGSERFAPTPGFYAPAPGLFGSTPPAPPPQWAVDCPRRREGTPRGYEYYFTRGAYSDGGGRGFFGRRGGGSWATDYPKADHQFLVVVERLANLGSYPCENAIALSDPELRRYPFLYILEVGRMALPDEELQGLRNYLLAGGFLVVDDFWGEYEWANFQQEIARVLPEYPIVDLPLDHDLFKTFYNIDEILQVPSINNGRWGDERAYAECRGGDPCIPFTKGIFDDQGRLMVVINGNTDLGDAWEWAEQPDYPLDRSTYAYEMGVNLIVYSMSH